MNELLRRVLDAPDDDGARLVYADWLQERADPRGELIILQLKKRTAPLSPDEAEREAALIEAHADAWQGRLGSITQFVEFEGGFLHGCSLREVPVWASRQPEWRTVRHLGVQRDARFLGALLESEMLSRLTSLRISDECVGPVLEHAPEGLKTLVIDGSRFDVAALFASARLANVSQVELREVRQKLVFERDTGARWKLHVSLKPSPWAHEKKYVSKALSALPPALLSELTVTPAERLPQVKKVVGAALVR